MDHVRPMKPVLSPEQVTEENPGGGAFLAALSLAARWVPSVPGIGGELRLEFRPDQLLRVATQDGAHVVLGRYLARGQRRFREPVILCHGLGANRFTFDFGGRHTLARQLAERGFEAWILELRGRGLAGAAKGSSFDRQVEHDVGTALRTVLAAGGAKEALWVGHSKGGMLALAHLAKHPRAPIRALATLGSPTSFTEQTALKPFARVVRPLLSAPAVPIEKLSKLALVVPPPDWFMRYLVHPENLEPEVRRRALANVGADVAGGVGRQFLGWIQQGRWTSEDGQVDYAAGLRNVAAPALLIGGTRDLLSPPSSAHHAAKWLAGAVETVTAGRESGFREDYGHGDLVLGRHAPEEIYPRVIQFLERRASAAE